MARIKDKKISIWKVETIKVNGVNTTSYLLAIPNKIWAYYKETGGNKVLDSANGLVYNNTIEDCIFQINYRKDITTDLVIQFNGQVYDIQHVNNFEGYRKDLVISAKLGNPISSYKGMYLF